MILSIAHTIGGIICTILLFLIIIFLIFVAVSLNVTAFTMLRESVDALRLSIKNMLTKNQKDKTLIYIGIDQREPDDWSDFTWSLLFTVFWLIIPLAGDLALIFAILQ